MSDQMVTMELACQARFLAYQLAFGCGRSNQRYFACMVDCHHQSRLQIIYATLIECKKCLMKGQCVIFCGLILMTVAAGASLHVALVIPLVKYVSPPSYILLVKFCIYLTVIPLSICFISHILLENVQITATFQSSL